MKVSLIIPTYNSENKIRPTLEVSRKILKKKIINEIVVVDDGSIDKTAQISKKYAKVFSLKQNQGKGAAMRYGASKAKGEVVVFMDDSQFDPRDIQKLLEKMRKTKADMVVGERDFSEIPWYRRITNNLTKLAILLGTGKKIRDAISGFRVMKKKDFQMLETKENRYAVEAEINFKSLLRGFKIEFVPVTVSYAGEAKKSALRNINHNIKESLFNIKSVLKIWFGILK